MVSNVTVRASLALALSFASSAALAGNTCTTDGGALGAAAAGSDALACGRAANAASRNATAVGTISVASDENTSAFGYDAQATGLQSSAIGAGTRASGESATAAGYGAHAEGTASTATGAYAQSTGGYSTANGYYARATGTTSTAIGAASTASGAYGVAIGAASAATADNSVALGTGSIADRTNTVSVGSAARQRQITNVAAGTEATDAANVGQVQDGDAATLQSARGYTDQRLAQVLGTDLVGFDRRIGALESRMGAQDIRISRLGALSAAMTQMTANAMGTQSARGRLSVGAGWYGGEKALSVGYGRKLGTRLSMTLGGAFSASERSAGVGFGVDL